MRYYRPPKPKPQQHAPSRMTYQDFMQSPTNGLTPDDNGKTVYGRPDPYKPPMEHGPQSMMDYGNYLRTGEMPDLTGRQQVSLNSSGGGWSRYGGATGAVGGPSELSYGAGSGTGTGTGYLGAGGGGGGDGNNAISQAAANKYDYTAFMAALQQWIQTRRGRKPQLKDFPAVSRPQYGFN